MWLLKQGEVVCLDQHCAAAYSHRCAHTELAMGAVREWWAVCGSLFKIHQHWDLSVKGLACGASSRLLKKGFSVFEVFRTLGNSTANPQEL